MHRTCITFSLKHNFVRWPIVIPVSMKNKLPSPCDGINQFSELLFLRKWKWLFPEVSTNSNGRGGDLERWGSLVHDHQDDAHLGTRFRSWQDVRPSLTFTSGENDWRSLLHWCQSCYLWGWPEFLGLFLIILNQGGVGFPPSQMYPASSELADGSRVGPGKVDSFSLVSSKDLLSHV